MIILLLHWYLEMKSPKRRIQLNSAYTAPKWGMLTKTLIQYSHDYIELYSMSYFQLDSLQSGSIKRLSAVTPRDQPWLGRADEILKRLKRLPMPVWVFTHQAT